MFKTKYKNIFLFFIPFLVFFSLSIVVFAQPGASVSQIENPLKSDDVQDILENILDLVTVIGSIILVLFIIFSGYKFVMAQGNPGKISEAKNILIATVIGGAILLGANIIANAVINTVKETINVEGK